MCPVNSYQDEEGSPLCKPCADTEITESDGSTNKSDCFGVYLLLLYIVFFVTFDIRYILLKLYCAKYVQTYCTINLE